MADLLATQTAELSVAHADTEVALHADPLEVTSNFEYGLLHSLPQPANVLDEIPLFFGLEDDQLPSVNELLSPDAQSVLFSYDGPPTTQYDRFACLGTQYYTSPLSLRLSPTSDGREVAIKSWSVSSEQRKTASSPSSPRPGQRRPRVRDDRRRKFLERNRIAAKKHRKRKKEFMQGLESMYKEQLSRKDQLKAEVSSLRAQALDLQESLFLHAQCDNRPIQDYLNSMIGCLCARRPM